MTKRHGYALLAALVALVAAISAGIYVGVSAGTGNGTHPRGRAPLTAAPASAAVWVGAWSSSPVGAEPGTGTAGLARQTVRNVVHADTGGTAARITLSNLFGRTPLLVTHASLAVADDDDSAGAVAETMRRLTFGGSPSVTITAGRQVTSDAVAVRIPDDTDVVVSTYSPTPSGPVTYHPHARQISYAAQGDQAEQSAGAPFTRQVEAWRYLTAVDVLSDRTEGTLVAFGDSLTDGDRSTVGADHRWPDRLADRLRAAVADGQDVPRYGVVNEGISGNRILTDSTNTADHGTGAGTGVPPHDNPSGLARFDRDVLDRTGVKAVIIDLGVNDVMRCRDTCDAQDILDGLRTLVRRAHARGLRVVGATLMPFGGRHGDSPEKQAMRQEINEEIRAGRVYDAVADFDAAVRDPYAPNRLRPEYDSGDHLHLNDRGYRRMAEAVDLGALEGAGPAEL
jgi:lysophospholipase L1-like esterase